MASMDFEVPHRTELQKPLYIPPKIEHSVNGGLKSNKRQHLFKLRPSTDCAVQALISREIQGLMPPPWQHLFQGIGLIKKFNKSNGLVASRNDWKLFYCKKEIEKGTEEDIDEEWRGLRKVIFLSKMTRNNQASTPAENQHEDYDPRAALAVEMVSAKLNNTLIFAIQMILMPISLHLDSCNVSSSQTNYHPTQLPYTNSKEFPVFEAAKDDNSPLSTAKPLLNNQLPQWDRLYSG
ncbi:hypothetical protein B0J14DRAFT_656680 [Halenospora varia]|nr:hypothetical protein B0J14DRAFT_656680 [Halenospora varia]